MQSLEVRRCEVAQLQSLHRDAANVGHPLDFLLAPEVVQSKA
jgi:hypothetical protein